MSVAEFKCHKNRACIDILQNGAGEIKMHMLDKDELIWNNRGMKRRIERNQLRNRQQEILNYFDHPNRKIPVPNLYFYWEEAQPIESPRRGAVTFQKRESSRQEPPPPPEAST